MLLLILAIGFGSGVYVYRGQRERLLRRLLVAEADVIKIFKLIGDDVGRLEISKNDSSENSLIVERLKTNLTKMEGYLKKELSNIKK